MTESHAPQPTPAGPEPATKGAADNPYVPSAQNPELRIEKREPSPPNSQFSIRNSQSHEVIANPATLSHATSTRPSPAAGTAIGTQLIGSERVFRGLAYSFELLKWLVVIVLVGVLVQLFVATVFRISGESMLPNFVDGQFVLVDKVSYLVGAPVRGDVVVIQFPGDPENRKFIKRVVGLPGETVEVRGGSVYVDGSQLEERYLPPNLVTTPELTTVLRGDEYFVVGDNRPNSNDSRFFGPVPIDKFIGKSQAILSGSAFGWVAQPAF